MIRNYVLIFIFGALFLPAVITNIPEFDEIYNVDKVTQNQNYNQLYTANPRLPFIQNTGQIESDQIKYYAKTFAGTIYVTDSNLIYQTSKNQDDKKTTLVINEKFLGNSLQPQGNERSASIVNYFKGTQDNWKTNIPTYNYVSLGQVWNNVDVDLKAYGNNVEKIFTVHPGGDPSDIKISFEGILSLGISHENELAIDTDLGDIFLSKPVGYQIIDGKRYSVPTQYAVLDSSTYGFSVLSYDPRFDLVIDPLIASTFVGGSGSEIAYSIAFNNSSSVYITGDTDDALTDFPTTAGAYNNTQSGSDDVFVSKFNGNLTSLSASTFIGGSGDDTGYSITVDDSNNVYITGTTVDAVTDFPTTAGAYDTTHNGGNDVFVSKFNSALTTLSASTFIGGSGNDYGRSVAINSSNAYITGQTQDSGTDFPITAGAYDTTHNGGNDVFISKFNSTLGGLSASTFLGSSGNDIGYGLAIDDSGNVYITGSTPDDTTDLPTTAGAYDTTHNGADDVFISKFNSALTTLSASTFIGGSSTDIGYGLAIDGSSNIYITGETTDAVTDFPTTAGAYDTTHNGLVSDVFVSKFNSALTTLSASTFLGGGGNDFGRSITIDSFNHAYVTGQTADSGTDLPTTAGAYDTTHNGGTYDVFISKFNSALTTLSASTFIGGNGNENGYGIIVDDAGNVFITGETQDVVTDFPTTAGAYDTTHNGGSDVFVSNFDCDLLSSGEACIPVLTSGSSASVSVGSGGTAEVELPSGNNLAVTLPAGVSGTITFTDTDSGNSDSNITFFGDIIDIDPTNGASCTGGCTISFTFTGSDATDAGMSPSQAKIYHDSNENGSFESGEGLATTVTGSDPYNATATASFTSKFAVGGVRANVVAAAQSLSSGGFFDFLNSCDPDGFAKGKSLKVYEVSYDKCENKKMQILAYSTCGPITAQVTTQNGRYTLGISSTQPFLNDEEKKLVLGAEISPTLESFNLMLKDKRDSFTDKIYLNQCSDIKTYSHQTGYTSEQQNPFFYDSYDHIEEIKQDTVLSDPESILLQGVMVDPEPTQDEQSDLIVDPEPTPQNAVVDPEPTRIKQNYMTVDPEPSGKNTKDNFVDMLVKAFSKIFHRQGLE